MVSRYKNDKSPRSWRVGINAHLLSGQPGYRRAGIHQYTAQVLKNLPTASSLTWNIIYTHAKPMNLDETAGFSFNDSRWPTENRLIRILWEQTAWPVQAALQKIDLLHGMAFSTPLVSWIPSVVTVYDLSFMHYPDTFPASQRNYLQSQTRRSCLAARRVITISKSTCQDVHDFFQIPLDLIDVIPPGVDPHYQPLPPDRVNEFRRQEGLPEKVILHVGTLQPRKNLPVLLEAVARLDHHNLVLVLVGGKGWHYDEIFSRVKALGLEDMVRFTGYVADRDLPLWYNVASVMVFPSIYEGFGMPVIESMACGTPVIATESSSIPEAGGVAALYFDHENVDTLVSHLSAVLESDELVLGMREKGLEQARKFSWTTAGMQTAQVYRRILAEQ